MRYATLLILILSTASGCDMPGQTTTPAAQGSLAQNKKIVRGYIEEIINGDHWDAWDKYFQTEIGFNGKRVGRLDMQRRVASFKAAYPDMKLTIEEQIAEGDRVVTRVTCRGTHLGIDEGVAPSGRRVSYAGIAIDRIKDGKVIEMRYLGDNWERIRQIREEPPAP